MKLRQHILAGLAVTYTLSLVGCGGSVSAPPTAGMDTLGASTSSLTPITPIDNSSIQPLDAAAPEEISEEALPEDAAAPDQASAEPAASAPAEGAPEEKTETPASETPSPETPEETAPAVAPAMPADLNVLPPFNPGTTSSGGAAGMSLTANLKVDRDLLNQWQAVNVTSDGSSLFIAAIDQKMPAKGTVIQMDAESGESWKNLGKSLLKSIVTLGLGGYAMRKSIKGIALDTSGNIVVNDSTEYLYQLAAPKFSVKKIKAGLSGGMDIAAASNAIYVATSSGLQKYDTSLAGGSAFGSVNITGGIGTDSAGNVYAVSGSTIKKLDNQGNATDAVPSGLTSPIDVAVGSNGHIYVLDIDSVKEFKPDGTLKSQFGSGDFQSATGLCVDPMGAVYVSDLGSSHKDSQILKYSSGSGFSTASQRYVSTLNAPDVAE